MRLRIDVGSSDLREQALEKKDRNLLLRACESLNIEPYAFYKGHGIWDFPRLTKKGFEHLDKSNPSTMHVVRIDEYNIVFEDSLDWWERRELTSL